MFGCLPALISQRKLLALTGLLCVLGLQFTAAGIDIAEFMDEEGTSLNSLIELTDVGLGLFAGWLIYR